MTDVRSTPGTLTASLVLGITGGVVGIVSALLVMMIGGLGAAFAAEGAGTIVGLGFAAVFLGVLGIIGGALARGRPKAAAWCQGIAAIGGFIAVSAGWIIAGPLLLVGTVTAITGHRRYTRPVAPAAGG